MADVPLAVRRGAEVPHNHGFLSAGVRQDPYPFYAALRSSWPSARRIAKSDYWLIGRYDDVEAVLNSPGVFSSSVLSTSDGTLLGADPPAHARARRIVTRALSQSLRGIEERVQAIAAGLLDRAAGRPAPELIADLAAPLPVNVMAQLLGLPSDDVAALTRWRQTVVARSSSSGPDHSPAIGGTGDTADSLLRAAISQRLAEPGEDLIGALLHPGRDHLSPDEALSVCKLLLVAGTETTTGLIGNCALALMRLPGELAGLRSDPSRAAAIVEETLRYEPPVQFVLRAATRDADIAGRVIPGRSHVLAVLASANRDETRIAEPERFDSSRASKHLAFGAGAHRCPGAWLARLEARTAICGLVQRNLLDVAPPSGSVEMAMSVQLRGPARVPLARVTD